MRNWLILAMVFCFVVPPGTLYAWEKDRGHRGYQGPEKIVINKGGGGGDASAKARAEQEQKQRQEQYQVTDVDLRGEVESTNVNENANSATSSSNWNGDVSVGAPVQSLRQTYKQVPGVVNPDAVLPESVHLWQLSKSPTEAAFGGVVQYIDECNPIDTPERPLNPRVEENFIDKFYVSFTPHQDYLAIQEGATAGVKQVSPKFPTGRVKCLGVLFIAANGKEKVTPDQLLIGAINQYVRGKMSGPYRIHAVPLLDTFAANRGVAGSARGLSIAPGITTLFSNVTQGALGGSGTFGSSNAFNDVRIGITFVLFVEHPNGIYVDFGRRNWAAGAVVPTPISQKLPVKPAEIAKKEALQKRPRGHFAGNRRRSK